MEPQCPYFRNCGGCTSQHIDYSKQLENKKQQLASTLDYQDIKVFCASPYAYRNRMDFIFHEKGLGLRRMKNWKSIIDVEHCPIANNKINELLQEVRSHMRGISAFNPLKKEGMFRYALIRATKEDTAISFVINEDASGKDAAISFIKEYANVSRANHIMAAFVAKDSDMSTSDNAVLIKGSELMEESLLGKTFYFPIQGFFQNNTAMAEMMQEYCSSLLKKYPTQGAHLLDLYGGVGTFGVLNAGLFQRVHIIEEYPAAVECAKKNAKINNAQNAEAICIDAKSINKLRLPKPLLVITDPPRSGMHPKAIQYLNAYEPEVIIYISCNIQQLKKELPKFKNYQIRSAALFDLFPQTPHSEAVVELVRKEN